MKPKRAIFSVALAVIPLLFFVLVEGGMRLAGVGAEDQHLFQELPGKPEYLAVSPAYLDRYFTGFRPSVAFNPFEKEKQESTFRVMVLGGSSTAGFPYQFYYGFPARLSAMLEAAAPTQRIEVVNLGMTAVNSYTLWDVKKAVARAEPDAVIIYAGHNEYYGAFGSGSSVNRLANSQLLKRTILRLKRLVLYRWLEGLLSPAPNPEGAERTMMATVVSDSQIDVDGPVFRDGIEQFEANIREVVKTFRGDGIPVYVGTVVSNLRDQKPLGENQQAADAFRIGTDLLAENNLAASRTAFLEAKEFDNIRFRAPEEINEVLTTVSSDESAELIDIQTAFTTASDFGIEGGDLFTDHLHPNVVGYDLIARQFFEALRAHPKLVQLESSPVEYAELDPIGRSHADMQIARLVSGFPFDKESTTQQQASERSKLLASRRAASYSDSLAVVALTQSRTMAQVLLDAARLARLEKDTTNALLYYRAVQNWQPFNETINTEALSFGVQSTRHDDVVGGIAQFAVNRSATLDKINTLGAIRLRQGRLEAAAGLLNWAESIDAGSKIMAFNKARLLILKGDTLEAARYFQIYQN